jgi:hypothetical protein
MDLLVISQSSKRTINIAVGIGERMSVTHAPARPTLGHCWAHEGLGDHTRAQVGGLQGCKHTRQDRSRCK